MNGKKPQTRKELIKDFLNESVAMIILFLILIWGISMMAQLTRSQDIGGVMKFYSQVALTLFGFTLIGGIFEEKFEEEIIFNLFKNSLIFLLAGVSFLLSFTLFDNALPAGREIVYTVPFYFGTWVFVSAIIMLMVNLLKYYRKIRKGTNVS